MCIPRCIIVTVRIHKAQSCNVIAISDFMYSVCNLVACGALPDNQTMIVAFEHVTDLGGGGGGMWRLHGTMFIMHISGLQLQ